MAQKRASRGGRPQPRRVDTAKRAPQKKREAAAPRATPEPMPPFRLGAVPGATPSKWIRHWRQQRPQQKLDLVAIDAADASAALREGRIDACICRRPIDGDDLHVVELYTETPVVVMEAESSLTAADELRPADLQGEVLLTPRDDVLGPLDLPTASPAFEPLETTADAIATVATGIGIVVVPMSLARLHHRKDVTFRPLAGAPGSAVVLAWRRDRDADDTQAFIAITRGRTARSSR
ncbi:LysR family substrate-binding domain-containing protein [Microbacterium sp. G2-8]|uniref:LysR family substrate-binding domain-containing protein n=1 Tax=Microbacterium sp. G2-8 TaxID=2842454 RepID=UPI0021AAA7CC|nr:LysR family substrate-binding domain-containing protein [Microbacterium sp. G2-8]